MSSDLKLQKLQALSSAIIRAQNALADNPSHENATYLQRLRRQRDALRATLPPLRAVAN